MFNRDKYISVLEKIVRDAKIKERYENAMELLYKLTNDLDAESINKAIALAKELLYGAKASRPILENLIDDLVKLATEHEQQELYLATGGVVMNDGIVITMKPGDVIHTAQAGSAGSGNIVVNPPSGPKPAGGSGEGGHNPEIARGGIVTMPKEEHEKLHGFGHEKQSQILEMVSKALNTVKELRISREALHRFIEIDLDNIEKKFAEKNKRYGQDQDGFYNFTQGAKHHYGDASPNNTFRMLMAYTSKHIVALEQPDALTNDGEFEERCLDVAVYMMIARAMKKATREGAEK